MFTADPYATAGARAASSRPRTASIETPVFMPVGTQGAVKAMTPRHLEEVGAEIILGNTYHLYLRPGDELIARRGGLHRSWAGRGRSSPTAAAIRCSASPRAGRSTRTACEFRSHLDGSAHLLTPGKGRRHPGQLGSDIAMVLDECPALPSTDDGPRHVARAHRPLGARCRERFLETADGRSGRRGPDDRRVPRRSSASSRAGLPGASRRKRRADCVHWVRGLRHRRAERRRAQRDDVCTWSS